MPLRIREIVDRQILNGIKLVAGASGAENSVLWVNVMEILDTPDSLQKDELLVTTGYQLANEKRYSDLIQKLERRGISGILIQLGYYVDDVPDYIIGEANRLHLPILTIPPHLTFSAIMHILIGEIQRQTAAQEDESTKRLLPLLKKQMEQNQPPKELPGYIFVAVPAPDRQVPPKELQGGINRISSYLYSQSAWYIRSQLPDGKTVFYLNLAKKNTIQDVIFELTILLTFLSEEQKISYYVGEYDLEDTDDLEKSFLAAAKCCKALEQIGAKRGVFRSKNMSFFSIFSSFHQNGEEILRSQRPELQKLLDYDRTHSTHYVHTLRVYLAHEGSQAKAANRLFIHRHTMAKRLEKICELGNWDLEDYYTRTYLSLCLMLHDYYGV